MLNCPVCGAATGLSWRECAECGHKLEPALPLAMPPLREREPEPVPEPAIALPPGTTACLQHPERAAVVSCSICAEPFCASCVDHVGPGATCAACTAAEGSEGPSGQPVATPMTKLAREALILSIVGFFCCGIILQPMAIVKAVKVRRQAKISPVPIKGEQEATIAMVISLVSLTLWIIYVIAQVVMLGNLE